MALTENKDYVFVPFADLDVGSDGMIQGCVICTKTHIYTVPDKNIAKEASFKEMFMNALTNTEWVETYNFGDKKPREVIQGMIENPETSLKDIDSFFVNFQEKWNAVKRVSIAELKMMKVTNGIFGGSISVKYEGKMLYTPVVMRIKKPHRHWVKDFYKDILERFK